MNAAPSLPELQRLFADTVLGDGGTPLAEWVNGKGLAPEARLQIYRNLIRHRHTAALGTAYPAVRKLVGEAFFEAAAARYLSDAPLTSGNLQDYGAGFPALLAAMPQTAGLPYVADVARLEWARQESYLAADAAPLEAATLADLPEDRYATLRFALHPSLRLVESAHPIWDIWLFCQEPSPGRLQLKAEGQCVAVWRDGAQLAMRAVAGGDCCFLNALRAAQSLAAAYETALRLAPDFDLAAALQWLCRNGLVTGIVSR